MTGTHTGRCLCGAVTYRATPTTGEVDVCHCGMCRRWGGGPAFALTVTDFEGSGDTLSVYPSSEWAERLFCSRCGTGIAYRLRDGSFTSLMAFTLDEVPSGELGMEIFIDEKPETYSFAGDRKRLTGAEVIAMFGGDPGGQQ